MVVVLEMVYRSRTGPRLPCELSDRPALPCPHCLDYLRCVKHRCSSLICICCAGSRSFCRTPCNGSRSGHVRSTSDRIALRIAPDLPRPDRLSSGSARSCSRTLRLLRADRHAPDQGSYRTTGTHRSNISCGNVGKSAQSPPYMIS